MRSIESSGSSSASSAPDAPAATNSPPAQPNRELTHFPVLDGLRGFAAVGVALIHYSLGPSLRWPMLGRGAAFFEMSPVSLDTFFILSGFLIGGILLRFKDAPNYYRTFYQRRFVRIFPLYYLWIGLFCLFYFFAQGWGLEPPAHLSSAFYLLSFVFFFQNLVPSVIESTFFVAPTWTLVVEEHFYLLAPICIRRMSPRRLVQVLVAILVIAPILRGVLFEFIGHRDDWADIATRIWSPCRADSLALGVLLAVIWNSEKTREWLRAHAPRSAWGMLAGSSIALSLGYMASANLSHCRFLDVTVGRSAVELASFSLIVYLICRPLSAFGKFLPASRCAI